MKCFTSWVKPVRISSSGTARSQTLSSAPRFCVDAGAEFTWMMGGERKRNALNSTSNQYFSFTN